MIDSVERVDIPIDQARPRRRRAPRDQEGESRGNGRHPAQQEPPGHPDGQETAPQEPAQGSPTTSPPPQSHPAAPTAAPASPATPPAAKLTKMDQALPNPLKFDMEPEQFWKYYAALLPHEQDRVLVYPYRLWPVCDVLQPLSQEDLLAIQRKEKSPPSTNIGKISRPLDPHNWRQEILHRWGSGDYHFKLNDTRAPLPNGKVGSKTICMSTIQGLRDLNNYPPDVNISELVVSDPANQSYIRWRQLKGLRTPGVNGEGTGDDDDMANTEAVKALTGTVDGLVNKLTAQQTAAQARPDPSISANARAAEVVADAAKAGQSIIAEAIKTARDTQVRQSDPHQYFKDVHEAASTLVGKPSAPSGPGFQDAVGIFTTFMQAQANQFQTMITLIQDSHRSQMDEMRTRIKMAEDRMTGSANSQSTAPAAPPVGAPHAPKSLLSQIKEVKEAMDLMGGGGGDDSGVPKWVPYAVQGASMLVSGIANIIYNSKLQPGQAPQAPPIPETDIDPLNPDGDADGASSQETKSQPSETEQLMNLVKNLEGPLLQALREGKTGTQFAAEMIVTNGDMTYSWMVEQGTDKLIQYLQMYPPLWSQLIRIPDRFSRFLEEFLDAPKARILANRIKEAINHPGGIPRPQAHTQAHTQAQPAAGPRAVEQPPSQSQPRNVSGGSVEQPRTSRPRGSQSQSQPQSPNTIDVTPTPVTPTQ